MGHDTSTQDRNYSIQRISQAYAFKFFININSYDSAATPFALEFSGSGEYKFYNSYTLRYGALSQEQRDSLLFSIIKLNTVDSLDQDITEYYSFEESEVEITELGAQDTDGNIRAYSLSYSSEEEGFLNNLYGNVEPNFDFSVAHSLPSDLHQNSILRPTNEYDLISSLGDISQESFTVSATTGSVTGLITEQAETITDVGGVVARGRRNTVGDVTTTIGVGSAATTRTVTTSGY